MLVNSGQVSVKGDEGRISVVITNFILMQAAKDRDHVRHVLHEVKV